MIEELLNQSANGEGLKYGCTFSKESLLKFDEPLNYDAKFEKLMNIQNITYL